MCPFKTEQEAFWAGEFGNEYVDRNNGADLVASNLALFSKVLSRTRDITSVIEFGSNRGLNLKAIQQLLPSAELSAIEINAKAVAELEKLGKITIYHQSLLDFVPDYKRELAIIKGVMIHLNPDYLAHVYNLLYNTSSRYVCIAEYYNPTPVEVSYRGHNEKLFKRDFAGEMMDMHPDLQLLDYGFCYKRDNVFLNGDFTWFLMEKRN